LFCHQSKRILLFFSHISSLLLLFSWWYPYDRLIKLQTSLTSSSSCQSPLTVT
jgi:hypothetical protein